MKGLINIALISVFLISGCTTQTNLPPSADGEMSDTEIELNQEQETLKSEQTLENLNKPDPTLEPQKTYVAPAPKPKTQPKPAPAVQQNCHPSYSGCLRGDASDYDCAGGSGNGPYYTGAVRVIGPDVFGLDRDHDGLGCE